MMIIMIHAWITHHTNSSTACADLRGIEMYEPFVVLWALLLLGLLVAFLLWHLSGYLPWDVLALLLGHIAAHLLEHLLGNLLIHWID